MDRLAGRVRGADGKLRAPLCWSLRLLSTVGSVAPPGSSAWAPASVVAQLRLTLLHVPPLQIPWISMLKWTPAVVASFVHAPLRSWMRVRAGWRFLMAVLLPCALREMVMCFLVDACVSRLGTGAGWVRGARRASPGGIAGRETAPSSTWRALGPAYIYSPSAAVRHAACAF